MVVFEREEGEYTQIDKVETLGQRNTHQACNELFGGMEQGCVKICTFVRYMTFFLQCNGGNKYHTLVCNKTHILCPITCTG